MFNSDIKELSIDEQIDELKKNLEAYDRETNIHSFLSTGTRFLRRFELPGLLEFEVSKKLKLSKNNNISTKEENNDQQKERITNFQWAGEGLFSNRIISVTNNGNAYVFNSESGNIIYSKNFSSGGLNACAIEQTENQLFAVGGFDGSVNLQTIDIDINNNRQIDDEDNYIKKFNGHQGSVSAIQFMNSSFLISSSLDSTLMLWDINSQGRVISTYKEHTSEVSGLDVNEMNGNIFASGSGDTTVKIWDVRNKNACVATFQGSDSSINCVKFLPARLSTVVAGSEDSSIKIYDLRAVRELGGYKKDKNDMSPINSVGFSKSGVILFASGSYWNEIYFWNIFGNVEPFDYFEYEGKKNNCPPGLNKVSINADKKKIAFIDFDEIVIIK